MNEPVAIGGAFQALITAVIALLVAFNVWHPTDTQIAAVLAVYTALVGVVTLIVRQKVTPVPKAGPAPAPSHA